MDRTTTPVQWHPTGDARQPYVAQVGGETWHIRVREFPEDPTPFVLMVDGRPAAELLEWPPAWKPPATVPAAPDSAAAEDADQHERGSFDAEMAHFERTRGIRPSGSVGETPAADTGRDVAGNGES